MSDSETQSLLLPSINNNKVMEKQVKKKRFRSSLFLLGISELLGGSTLSLLAPFYSKEAESHDVSVMAAGTVFSSVFVVQIVLTPFLGKYISKIGSVNLFVFGAIATGITNIAFAFVPLLESGSVFLAVSLIVRSITAIGESALFTAVYPLASSRAPSGSRSTVLSWMETMYGVGTTIGPFLGGLLYSVGGFYLPFLVCGGLLVLCGILGAWVLDKKVETEAEEDEVVMEGVRYRTLLTVPRVVVAAVVLVITGLSTQWYQPSLEPYLRTQFGLNPFQASLVFMLDGASYAIATPVWGYLLDKGLDSTSALLLGCGVISLSYLGLAPVPPINPSILQVGLATVAHGVGMAANFIATLTVMLSAGGQKIGGKETEQLRGMVTSIWVTCESLGGFLGAAGGAAAYDSVGWTWSCVFVSGLQLVGMLLISGSWLCLSGYKTPTARKDVEKGEVTHISGEVEEGGQLVEEQTRLGSGQQTHGGKREGYGTMTPHRANG